MVVDLKKSTDIINSSIKIGSSDTDIYVARAANNAINAIHYYNTTTLIEHKSALRYALKIINTYIIAF